jgi:hypothetical protein
MIKETFLDKEYSLDEVPCVEDLLVKYFGKIEERIRKASSGEEALEIVNNAISNFKRECLSEILLEFLKYDTKVLIEKYWKPVQINLSGNE